MSCASTGSTVFRLTLLSVTLLVSCAFVASVVWLLRANGFAGRNESYYLSRINISAARGPDDGDGPRPTPADHYRDLVKIEIAMRRVEENSRRLKEYTKSLLWDNKDKSLWCVLFKDSERLTGKYRGLSPGGRKIDEEYIRTLRENKMREAVVHLRHHGSHHRRHD